MNARHASEAVVIEANAYYDAAGNRPLPRLIGPFRSATGAAEYMDSLGPLNGSWETAPLFVPDTASAARDAEVEELRRRYDGAIRLGRAASMSFDEAAEAIVRAEVQRAEDQANNLAGDPAVIERERDAALATLKKVREHIEEHTFRDSWNVPAVYVKRLLAILDESPTERETPADEWEYGIQPADEPDRWWNDPMPSMEAARKRANNIRGTWRVIRRRKAGPWEVVPDDRA